jgi:Protein of unknown function (DUF1588)/Protein of unknown function (DUF1585)/Protein of unknown function (DUF1592)
MKKHRGHFRFIYFTLLVGCVDPIPLETPGSGGEQGSTTNGGKGGQSQTGVGGQVGGVGAGGSSIGGSGPGGRSGTPVPIPTIAPMGPRALSQREFDNTLQTLSGGTYRAPRDMTTRAFGWLQFDRDPAIDGIGQPEFEMRWELAAKLAPVILMNAKLPLDCNALSSGPDKCYELVIRTLVPLILRRETNEPLVASLMDFAKTLEPVARNETLTTLVATLLRLPEFLFITHHDRGADGPARNPFLSKIDMATRLSFLVTGTTPTADWTKTFDDSLKYLASISRDLASRSGGGLDSFFAQWLQLDRVLSATKDLRLLPKWETEKESVYSEGIAFFSKNGFANTEVRWPDLLTVPVGDGRNGFLMQRWFLATHAGSVDASPTRRGMFIRDRILCTPTPAPPADFPSILPNPQSPDATFRERLEAATLGSGNPCSACHQLVDPIGFGLENYDAAGLFRKTDHGKPIDASGQIALDSNMRIFNGANGLVNALADLPETSVCLVRNFTSFAFGYPANEQDDELVPPLAANLGSKFRLRDMLELVVTSIPFRTIEAKNIFPDRTWPRASTLPQPGKLDLASMAYVLSQFRAFRETASSNPFVMQIDRHLDRLREMERRLSI